MKIRQGFVSNSSSSSFLVVGLCQDDMTPEQIKKAEELGLDFVEDDHINVVGIKHSFDEYSVESFSFKDIVMDELKVRLAVGEEVEVKVFVGTIYS